MRAHWLFLVAVAVPFVAGQASLANGSAVVPGPTNTADHPAATPPRGEITGARATPVADRADAPAMGAPPEDEREAGL